MAWLREIGLEFVDIVKSDNEPAMTSLSESWSTPRAVKCGRRTMGERVSPLDCAARGATGSRPLEVKIDVTHSVWPWIAEQAGFLRTRFEVGRDGVNVHVGRYGVYLGTKATMGEVIVGNWNGVWLRRTFWRKTARERWE